MADRQKSIVDESTIKVTTVFSDLGEHAVLDDNATLDEKALAALGYKQEFKRFVSNAFRYTRASFRITDLLQGLHDVRIILRIVFCSRPASIGCIDHRLFSGLLRNWRSGMGLARGRYNDSIYRIQHG